MERLKKLSDELVAAANARPYDPDEYNRLIDELNKLHQVRVDEPKLNWIQRIIRFIKK